MNSIYRIINASYPVIYPCQETIVRNDYFFFWYLIVPLPFNFSEISEAGLLLVMKSLERGMSSPDLGPTVPGFRWRKTRLRAERSQNEHEITMAAVQAWQRLSRDHTPVSADACGFCKTSDSLEMLNLEPNIEWDDFIRNFFELEPVGVCPFTLRKGASGCKRCCLTSSASFHIATNADIMHISPSACLNYPFS